MLLPLLFQIFPTLLIHSAKLYYGDFSVFSSSIYNLTLSFFPYIFSLFFPDKDLFAEKLLMVHVQYIGLRMMENEIELMK